MERFTQWFGTGDNRIAGMASEHEEKYTVDELIDILLDKLARYEDTGLTPTEVKELKAGCMACDISRRDFEFAHEFPDLDHLRELVKAEKDGRLLPLPCRIGSEVYVISHKYRAGRDEWWINTGKFRPSDMEKIGDRVFLTYEDAKAKIFAMNKDNKRFWFQEVSGGVE